MAGDSQFKPGQSGNPKGKPRGARDKRTALRELLKPHAEALVAKAVELALSGDTTALKLCVDRLMPAYRPTDMAVEVTATGSLSQRGEALIEAMSRGELSPDNTREMLQALAAQAKVIEFDELEARIQQLEARQ